MNQVSTTNSKRRERKQNNKLEVNNLVYGKVPPHANDIEQAILGAIMLDKNAIDMASEMLKPECFYQDAHQRIFSAMIDLLQKSQKIDLLTVTERLNEKNDLELVGGPHYVTLLTNAVVSAANMEDHCRIVMQKFMLREIIRIGSDMVVQGYENGTEVFDLLDEVEANIMGITVSHLKKDFSAIDEGLVEVLNKIEDLRKRDESITGVPSGFPSIDRITHGWQPTDLIILAARPSVGKTAFALNLVRNAALHPTKPTAVGVFSMEMSRAQLVQRLLASESEIHLDKIMQGKLEDEHMKQLYEKGVARLARAPIFIDDTAGINMFQLRSKVRRMKNKHNVGLIIIDYLQLMTGDSGGKNTNREQEISKISRQLKTMAKELEVPVIALSQLSRAVEQRGQKVPMLSDLRESGAIEQDADQVAFLYRPSEEEVKADSELRNKGMIRFAKNRHGVLEEIVMKFYGSIQRWMDLDEADRYEGGMGNNWKPVQLPKADNYYEVDRGEPDENLPF